MKKILVLALMMMASISYGQKFTLSFDAQLAVPQGDYKDITPEAGYGLRADVLFRPKKSKFIKFGLDLGLLETNRTTQYFSAYVYGFYEDYKISATSNVVSLMFLARFQPDYFHKVKPFVDLIGGYNIFFSTASIERLTYYSSYNNSYSNSTKSHWAFSYGTAGGSRYSFEQNWRARA